MAVLKQIQSPHLTSVKYCGGCSVHRRDNISTVGDSFSTVEVAQYSGGITSVYIQGQFAFKPRKNSG